MFGPVPRPPLMAVVVVLLALVPVAKHAASAAVPATLVGPKAYYLALGDSLAYGLQPNLHNDEGYDADFFADLQAHGTQTVIDMGCSEETTVTFIYGGCPDKFILPPHYKYAGPQLQAALTFIRQHPGQVSPVTIDIGANDFLNNFDPATCTFTGLTQTVQTLRTTVPYILTQLQTALQGSGDLIGMTYYFPYQNQCPSVIPTVMAVNNLFTQIAQAHGVLMAPVFEAFGGATTPNPNLCTYTWICQQNTFFTCKLAAALCIHPTTEGYMVMANTIEEIAGY